MSSYKIIKLGNIYFNNNVYVIPNKQVNNYYVGYLLPVNKKRFLTDKRYNQYIVNIINQYYKVNNGYFYNQYINRLKLKYKGNSKKRYISIKPNKQYQYYYKQNRRLINIINNNIKTGQHLEHLKTILL